MNQEILSLIKSNPQANQAVGQAVQQLLQDPDVTPDGVNQMVRMLDFVVQNPDSYPDFRKTAIDSGIIDDEDLPEQFDAGVLTIILIALKVVQQQMNEGGPGFARGGLNAVARMGRNGDSRLAHINPFEDRLLRAYGGAGGVNPATGMPEYGWLKKTFKSVVKAIAPVLPIILAVAAPGIGTALGGMLSGGALAGSAAGMLGSAAIGGLTSAVSGGNVLQGALGGALGAGAGTALGGYVGETLGATLGEGTKNVVGSALIGGAQGALSGQGFGTGAVQGAIGGYAGNALSNAASGVSGALGAGLQTAGTQFGNALTMGASPQQALIAGGLSGLAAGLDYGKPSDLAIKGLQSDEMLQGTDNSMGKMRSEYAPGETAMNMETGEAYMPAGDSPLAKIASGAQTPASQGPANKGFSVGQAAQMLPLLTLFGNAQTPEEVQQVVAQMTPEQQKYFNRPTRSWNWDTLNAAAKMQGLPIGSYIARNWDKVGGGMYDNTAEDAQVAQAAQAPVLPQPVALARGGALNRMAYLAAGGGTGRSDSIAARLSDGEYVMDAETVALLGDGSTKAGARRLDEMRSKIRTHKGKSMAGGKFSANAKSPLAYLKERA